MRLPVVPWDAAVTVLGNCSITGRDSGWANRRSDGGEHDSSTDVLTLAAQLDEPGAAVGSRRAVKKQTLSRLARPVVRAAGGAILLWQIVTY